jgi:glycopeptide antibiotics resistance protein
MRSTFLKHPLFVQSIPWMLVIWTLLIVYLTIVPSEQLIDVKMFKYDKAGHFIIFGGWTFLVGLIQIIYFGNLKRALFPIPLAGTLFGALIEVMQYILPFRRHASFEDMIANTLGCLLAFVVLLLIRKYLRTFSTSEPRSTPDKVTG